MSGEIIARGRIKVDAKRAIAKLRDHLLVDLHLYACEVARVAVATEATWLDATWDTDDVIFTFDGRALPAAAVVRAREQVLAPDPDANDGPALRVLGIGVSAALGVGPRFVDVFTADASGTTRVRFESKHLDEQAEADPPETKSVAPIAKLAGKTGMRVHVRKKIDLPAIERALLRQLPREVALLADATRDAPLVITFDGKAPQLTPEPVVLLRVDLDEPALRRGSLELLAATTTRGHTHFLDLGVRLAETHALGIRESADLPLRVIVDSARLPTNASRSQVQMESDVVRRVQIRMRSTFDIAIQELSKVVASGVVPKTPLTGAALGGHTVTFVEQRLPILEQLLGELAASVALASRSANPSDAERALLSLPLLRDVHGRPLSLANVRGGTARDPLHVYTGPGPLPIELEPWLTHVVWRQNVSAERALTTLVKVDAQPRVAEAKLALDRRTRALAHEPTPARLPKSADYVVRCSLEGKEPGLVGEVAVRRGRLRSDSMVRVLIDDRLLEEIPLPGAALPVEMVLSWPGRILGRFTYDRVERNDALQNAMLIAVHTAALAIIEHPADPELTRQAVHALVATSTALRKALDAHALDNLRIWPLTNGKLASLAELRVYAAKTHALCTGDAHRGPAADGRPVLLSEHAREVIALLGCAQVPYSRFLGGKLDALTLGLEAANAWLTVPIERPNVVGFVGVGPANERLFHGGHLLRERLVTFQYGPVLIVYEDRTAVPQPDLKGVLHSDIGELHTFAEEEQLLEAVVARVSSGKPTPSMGRRYLRTALEKLRKRATRPHPPKLDALLERVEKACALLPAETQAEAPPPKPAPIIIPAKSTSTTPEWRPRLMGGESRPVTAPSQGLAADLAKGLRAIDITSRHLASVEELDYGRPVRYDRRARIVYVNVKHDYVRALAGDPQRVLLLGVAAISEINRELAQVTDAEERRVLTDLLR